MGVRALSPGICGNEGKSPVGAENESMAFRQQIQSRTYPRLCRFQGGKNLCESKEYGEMGIARGEPGLG
jgi:hypothetical protein